MAFVVRQLPHSFLLLPLALLKRSAGVSCRSVRSTELPVSVPLRASASLPDKLKVSLQTESHNANLVIYPQGEGFAVDKMENKPRGFTDVK